MAVNKERYLGLMQDLESKGVTLVAVSKTKSVADILELYELGHRDFGENYVQELVDKQQQLPGDIRWHFIGHLQTNKVKYIAPFVHLVHGVDSLKLLKEIDKQAAKNNRVIEVLLQVHIATEETKFGLDPEELNTLLQQEGAAINGLEHIRIAGLMGMASLTDDEAQVRQEFQKLQQLYNSLKKYAHPNLQPSILSMGMSSDYQVAIEEGSTLVRIGSLIFGERNYPAG